MTEPLSAGPGLAVRLDKWLWAARLYKTRSLAAEEIGKGRVQVNAQAAKASRIVRIGDRITLRRQGGVQALDVLGLSQLRGPASIAQLLFRETEESLAAAQRVAESHRQGTEPALSQPVGRPTKRDRRQLGEWHRWSASIDDD